MAKQLGITKLGGTIGDITFYKSQDGMMARQKTTVSGNRLTDPAFARVRENAQEFGRAGKAGKVLRAAFSKLLSKSADGRVISRLVQAIMNVQKTDITSARGERNIGSGDASLLKGFNFNVKSPLSTVLSEQYTTAINRVTGVASVSIPAYIPQDAINAPTGTSHIKLISAASAIDFLNESYQSVSASSAEIAYGTQQEALLTLTHNLPANSTDPLFLVLGVEFYQEFNGILYQLKTGSFNALTIIAVDVN
jgi:hypothetical protein